MCSQQNKAEVLIEANRKVFCSLETLEFFYQSFSQSNLECHRFLVPLPCKRMLLCGNLSSSFVRRSCGSLLKSCWPLSGVICCIWSTASDRVRKKNKCRDEKYCKREKTEKVSIRLPVDCIVCSFKSWKF